MSKAASKRSASACAAAATSPLDSTLTRRHWATSSWAVWILALRLARSMARWNFGDSSDLMTLASGLPVDLRRDVPPHDHHDLVATARHQATRARTIDTGTASASPRRPTWRCSKASPSRSAAWRPASTTAPSVLWLSRTTRR